MNEEKDGHNPNKKVTVASVLVEFVANAAKRYRYFCERTLDMPDRKKFGLTKKEFEDLDRLIDAYDDDDRPHNIGKHHGIVMMARHLDTELSTEHSDRLDLIVEASIIGKEDNYEIEHPVAASLLEIGSVKSPKEIKGDVITVDKFALNLGTETLQITLKKTNNPEQV